MGYKPQDLNVTETQMKNYGAVVALNKSMMSLGKGGDHIAEYGGAEAVLGDNIMQDYYLVNKRINNLNNPKGQIRTSELVIVAQNPHLNVQQKVA